MKVMEEPISEEMLPFKEFLFRSLTNLVRCFEERRTKTVVITKHTHTQKKKKKKNIQILQLGE